MATGVQPERHVPIVVLLHHMPNFSPLSPPKVFSPTYCNLKSRALSEQDSDLILSRANRDSSS